jgi:GAF domain-containing protein
MKSYLSHTLANVVQRLSDAPEQTLSLVAARFSTELPAVNEGEPPDHVVQRLESVFEALSELQLQPSVSAALDFACNVLQAELPSEAVAAGLYDINADEVRIVAARGMEDDLLRGTFMSRERCFVARPPEEAFVISGGPGAADWLGSGEEGAEVLLCPIVCDANLLGVLAVADPLCAARFIDHDVALVRYVADQLSAFIQAERHRPSIPAP